MSSKYKFWCDTDTEPTTGKTAEFWLLWGIFKECIKQNVIIAVLIKVNAHLAVICRMIKKSIM